MKRKANRPAELSGADLSGFDDFLEWLDSEEGQRCNAALNAVEKALSNARVDVNRRKILWADGSALTLNQTVVRIARESQCQPSEVLDQVIGWLEMIYEPEDLTGSEMVTFEAKVEKWVDPYRL